MRTAATAMAISVLLWDVCAPYAHAQKGTGQAAGVARQAVKPEVVSLSGKLKAIKTGRCEMATGRAYLGTHILLETLKGKELNIHLGPAAALDEIVDQLPEGKKVNVKCFRTERMPKDHYVAQSLAFGDTSLQIRDEDFRPFWAQGSGGPRGARARQWGAGKGRGSGWQLRSGYGRGRRWRRGPGYGWESGGTPRRGAGFGRGWASRSR